MANNAYDVLRVAAGEVGYSRWNDPQPGTKYGRWYAQKTGDSYYGTSGVPYCAMFVSWVFNQAGAICPGLPGAYCPWIERDGRNAGRAVSKYSARPGDIVLYDWGSDGVADHVGIVEVNHGNYIQTIEGNTSSGSSGSQSNGGVVARRTRNWNCVRAIIRPTYGSSSSTPSSPSFSKPSFDVNKALDVDGYFGANTVAKLQKALGTTVDGYVSAQPLVNKQYLPSCAATGAWNFTNSFGGGSQLIIALQNKIGAAPDGWFGQESVRALQRYLGTIVDGRLDSPSNCVKELQRRLNAGTFMSGGAAQKPTATSDKVDVDGWWGPATTKALQRSLNTPVDGEVSSQSFENMKFVPRAGDGWSFVTRAVGSQMIKALQEKTGATADGHFGMNSVKALQRYLGVSVDGYCGNDTVVALQKAINSGKI